MDGGYAVVFRAYNEGAAYRFETSLQQAPGKNLRRRVRIQLYTRLRCLLPQEDSFFSHNERKYLPQHLSEIAPEFLGSLPAVVDMGRR